MQSARSKAQRAALKPLQCPRKIRDFATRLVTVPQQFVDLRGFKQTKSFKHEQHGCIFEQRSSGDVQKLNEFLFVCAARTFSYVIGNREAGGTQLFRISIKPTFIETLGKSVKFDGKIRSSVPDFEILETPMRPLRSSTAGLFALRTLLFAGMRRVVLS